MRFIDMHCDSLMKLFFLDAQNADLYDSKVTSVDFKRMEAAGQTAQFFAVFLPPLNAYEMFHLTPVSDEDYIKTLHGYLLNNVKTHSDTIGLAHNIKELKANEKAGKMSAVLTMEDGRAADGKMENLKRFYDMGFRALSLTWNFENCFGFPNSRETSVMNKGLTDFGRAAVSYMQELGMLVDVSHLSDGGFYDVAAICKNPFAATHSNCRQLSPHQRNLTDDMIRVLGGKGGVAGINFGPEFLNKDISCKDSTALLMAEHALHMSNIGGIECVGIGTDFDGINGNLEIADCSQMDVLEHALQKKGFTGSGIEKIFYKNVRRIVGDTMK